MITTRPATEADLPFLEDVFMRAMCPHITEARGRWDETKERDQFREQLQLEHTCVILLEDTSVGFYMAVEHDLDLDLHTICIAPDFQGRGLGTAILRRIMSDAKGQGRSVCLSVLKPNKDARLLYERLGFERTGETAHHYQMRLASKTG